MTGTTDDLDVAALEHAAGVMGVDLEDIDDAMADRLRRSPPYALYRFNAAVQELGRQISEAWTTAWRGVVEAFEKARR